MYVVHYDWREFKNGHAQIEWGERERALHDEVLAFHSPLLQIGSIKNLSREVA